MLWIYDVTSVGRISSAWAIPTAYASISAVRCPLALNRRIGLGLARLPGGDAIALRNSAEVVFVSSAVKR